jgi:hypothetical protein
MASDDGARPGDVLREAQFFRRYAMENGIPPPAFQSGGPAAIGIEYLDLGDGCDIWRLPAEPLESPCSSSQITELVQRKKPFEKTNHPKRGLESERALCEYRRYLQTLLTEWQRASISHRLRVKVLTMLKVHLGRQGRVVAA